MESPHRALCHMRTYLRVQPLHDHDELRQGEVDGLLIRTRRQAQVQAYCRLHMLHLKKDCADTSQDGTCSVQPCCTTRRKGAAHPFSADHVPTDLRGAFGPDASHQTTCQTQEGADSEVWQRFVAAMLGSSKKPTCQPFPFCSPLPLLLLLAVPLDEPSLAASRVLLFTLALLLRRCRVRRRLLKRSPTSSFLFISSFSLRRCALPTASASISSSSSRTWPHESSVKERPAGYGCQMPSRGTPCRQPPHLAPTHLPSQVACSGTRRHLIAPASFRTPPPPRSAKPSQGP